MKLEISIPIDVELSVPDKHVIESFCNNVNGAFAFASNEDHSHIILYAVNHEETEETD